MNTVELACLRAAARLSWVSSRSSGSSFESAYGTHAWVDALCLPSDLDGASKGLQDQRQVAIDSLRASLAEGIPRSDLAPVRTSVSFGTSAGSAPPHPAAGPPPSRQVANPQGRIPLAGLDSMVNSSPRASQNAARTGHMPARRSENMTRGPKGMSGPGKMQPGSHLGGMHVPESIPESGVAPSASDYSPKRFCNPFGPDVETDGDAVEGAAPRKPPSRVRPSMEARRKRLDLSALQARPFSLLAYLIDAFGTLVFGTRHLVVREQVIWGMSCSAAIFLQLLVTGTERICVFLLAKLQQQSQVHFQRFWVWL